MTEDYSKLPTIRVSIININSKEEILLVKHKKKDREYWVLPGGHLDYGETIAQCAERELKEETSLTGEFERIVFLSESIAPNNLRHIINIFVLLQVTEGNIQIGANEDIVCEVAYISLNEIKNITIYPNITAKILEKYQDNWNNKFIEVLETKWTD